MKSLEFHTKDFRNCLYILMENWNILSRFVTKLDLYSRKIPQVAGLGGSEIQHKIFLVMN